MNEITVAMISLLGTLLGSVLGIAANSRLVAYRLEELSRRVGEHNNFAYRMPVVEEQIKEIRAEIEELERGIK